MKLLMTANSGIVEWQQTSQNNVDLVSDSMDSINSMVDFYWGIFEVLAYIVGGFAAILALGVLFLVITDKIISLFEKSIEKKYKNFIESAENESITIFSFKDNLRRSAYSLEMKEFIKENTSLNTMLNSAKKKKKIVKGLVDSKAKKILNKSRVVQLPSSFIKKYNKLFDDDYFGMVNGYIEERYFELKDKVAKIEKDKNEYFENLTNKDNADSEVVDLLNAKLKEFKSEFAQVEKDMFNNLQEKLDEQLREIEQSEIDSDNETNLKTFNKVMNY